MPDEVVEQSTAVSPGAEEAPAITPEGETTPVVEAVAGDSGAAPAPVVPFNLATDEDIKALAAANPQFAGYLKKVEADAANAARQRRDAELRRENGTVETAQAYTRWVAEQISNGATPEELSRQVPLYVRANHDALRMEFAAALLKQAAEHGDETAAGLLENLKGDPDEAIRAAQAATDALVRRARADERAVLRSEIEAEVKAKVEAERRAAEIEARQAQITQPPTVSGTGPAITPPVNPASLPIDEYGARTPSERAALWSAWQAYQNQRAAGRAS